MADNNKAKVRQSKSNSAKYGAQYGITYNNKTKALKKHIAALKAVVTTSQRKLDNIAKAIATAEAALKSLPLKK
jgi:hypothetical protein